MPRRRRRGSAAASARPLRSASGVGAVGMSAVRGHALVGACLAYPCSLQLSDPS